MTSTPQISVVMSVYNAENYLREAIDSILNQTFSDFEFIIIEDCSTDSTMQILEEYLQKDSRIIIIKKTENKGTKGFIENLNLGLEKARGKYIARMDADDISDPNRFQKQFEALEKDPDLFIIGANLELIDKNNQTIGQKIAKSNDADIKSAMYNMISLYHPVLMFRNSNVQYRGKMYSCEDYDLYFQLMLQGRKMSNLPEFLLKYRILDSSVSRKDKTFIRWLFVEKARSLYKEKLQSGSDSYDAFVPEELSEILNPNFKNQLIDIDLAAQTAIKFSKKEELKTILRKFKTYYPSASIFKYKIASILPNPMLRMYSKIILP